MRIPHTPVKVDQFRPEPGVHVFLLSHFHADHLVGLCDGWSHGTIYCSAVTRALLLCRFGIDRDRVKAIPVNDLTPTNVWSGAGVIRSPSPVAEGGGAETLSAAHRRRRGDSGDASDEPPLPEGAVTVVAIDAHHIVGSVMFVLRCVHGVVLHTGDCKFNRVTMEPLLARLPPVDHCFVDSTWLHLAADRFLTRDGLQQAFRSIASHLDYVAKGATATVTAGETPPQRPSTTKPRFVVRVYLHNQFGKETLVQALAETIQADVYVDAKRIDLLRAASLVQQAAASRRAATISRAPGGGNEPDADHRVNLRVFRPLREWFARVRELERAEGLPDTCAAGARASCAPVDRHAGESPCDSDADSVGEAALLELLQAAELDADDTSAAAVATASVAEPKLLPAPGAADAVDPTRGVIEVVSSRKLVSGDALDALTARLGVPCYGVIMSGWARLAGRAASSRVWHLPYSLHSSGAAVVELVELVNPRSVFPLSVRPGRRAALVSRLAPHLRRPGQNEPCSLASLHAILAQRGRGEGADATSSVASIPQSSALAGVSAKFGAFDIAQVVAGCKGTGRGVRFAMGLVGQEPEDPEAVPPPTGAAVVVEDSPLPNDRADDDDDVTEDDAGAEAEVDTRECPAPVAAVRDESDGDGRYTPHVMSWLLAA